MKQRCGEKTRAFPLPQPDFQSQLFTTRAESILWLVSWSNLTQMLERKKWMYHSVNPLFFSNTQSFINSLTYLASWRSGNKLIKCFHLLHAKSRSSLSKLLLQMYNGTKTQHISELSPRICRYPIKKILKWKIS